MIYFERDGRTSKNSIRCHAGKKILGDPVANIKERETLKGVYPSKKWAQRVDKMTDSQVVAVYMRLKLQGKVK